MPHRAGRARPGRRCTGAVERLPASSFSAAPMPWEQPRAVLASRARCAAVPAHRAVSAATSGRPGRCAAAARPRTRALTASSYAPLTRRGARFVSTGTTMRVAERAGGRGPTHYGLTRASGGGLWWVPRGQAFFGHSHCVHLPSCRWSPTKTRDRLTMPSAVVMRCGSCRGIDLHGQPATTPPRKDGSKPLRSPLVERPRASGRMLSVIFGGLLHHRTTLTVKP